MPTILVVEDHPVFAGTLSDVLRRRGSYELETVRTAEDAVERLQSQAADLVIVDLSLPGRGGIWLIKQITHMQPGVPCLVLTGHNKREYLDQSLEAGARGYVLKEDLPGLYEGVETLLHGGRYISKALTSADPPPSYP